MVVKRLCHLQAIVCFIINHWHIIFPKIELWLVLVVQKKLVWEMINRSLFNCYANFVQLHFGLKLIRQRYNFFTCNCLMICLIRKRSEVNDEVGRLAVTCSNLLTRKSAVKDYPNWCIQNQVVIFVAQNAIVLQQINKAFFDVKKCKLSQLK